ncbi:methoxymalonate biosynthesis protein [Micromonospora tulbaghiae]|uniref:Methoxymalonate biosynthesis protein n=1 Tax=Micromonospora tulbaghiae TaxID=479978 RepID=A0A386WU44_9ACTN|nr:acyl carrier protein [Micromonospora tulbaghiae]AYF31965.1 methoxymalonate biosynthesis protein [Micromonospora tulbaghiae]
MTISSAGRTGSAQVESAIQQFLEERLKTAVAPDLDLFASGTVSSIFAMELVVHLEQTFGIVIAGPDLQMDNFRTVHSMTGMVLRLQEPDGA